MHTYLGGAYRWSWRAMTYDELLHCTTIGQVVAFPQGENARHNLWQRRARVRAALHQITKSAFDFEYCYDLASINEIAIFNLAFNIQPNWGVWAELISCRWGQSMKLCSFTNRVMLKVWVRFVLSAQAQPPAAKRICVSRQPGRHRQNKAFEVLSLFSVG